MHTLANNLVPSKEFFPKHPEWFSEIGGNRVGGMQYCLTNPELLAFCIQRVKEYLRDAPPDSIVSVSQNDGGDEGRCQCAKCLAIEKEEGGPSGPMLRFVNAVADAIKGEHPRAAIDTLAYQYTRKPPRLTKPRPNVIIRLCSIECSFAHPLDHRQNQAFAEDLPAGGRLANGFTSGTTSSILTIFWRPIPTSRAGAQCQVPGAVRVKGVFEEGNDASAGGEFAGLRAGRWPNCSGTPPQTIAR